MKKLLILFFIFLSIKGLAQRLPCAGPDFPTTPMPTPKGSISDAEAQQRMAVYNNQKNKSGLTDVTRYNPCGFLDLLSKLNDATKNYSGLRIYLAADTIRTDSLILVFVPTNYILNNGIGIQQDDKNAIYRISGDRAEILPRKDASNYIMSYRNHHMGHFTDDGRNATGPNSRFEETTYLWYDITLFRLEEDGLTGKTGMQGVLKYLIDKEQVDRVIVNLGAFDHTDVDPERDFFYHIMLVFNFYQNVSLKATFSGKKAISIPAVFNAFVKAPAYKNNFSPAQIKIIREFLTSFGFTDTGVPCPPPPPGKTCDQIGAILP